MFDEEGLDPYASDTKADELPSWMYLLVLGVCWVANLFSKQ